MRIESVDLFYLSMPRILDIGDGSQDALLVRIQAGDWVGWGECEASPLVSIASFVCPMSHSACKPVRDSVLGQRIDDLTDVERIGTVVRDNCLDLLQADHTLSGIDIALWDLMGQRFSEPVYRLLGYKEAFPKTPYASVLFGDSPDETLAKGRSAREAGYHAAKFGWGPFGRGEAKADTEQLHAAREGLGADGILLVDAGTVWRDDVERAAQCAAALREVDATWLEEPFVSGALRQYKTLAQTCAPVRLAGGEGAHNEYMAEHMIDHAGIGYVQIDAGRIGGISAAKRVADYAHARGVTYVNHTFTTHLALSASLQPFAGLENDTICEYPVEASTMAREMTQQLLLRDSEGLVRAPEAPGLGMIPDVDAMKKYVVDVEIRAKGQLLYRTPTV